MEAGNNARPNKENALLTVLNSSERPMPALQDYGSHRPNGQIFQLHANCMMKHLPPGVVEYKVPPGVDE